MGRGKFWYWAQNYSIKVVSALGLIAYLSLYSLTNYYKVSQFYTHPNNPVLWDKGITEYLVIVRSFLSVSVSFVSKRLTRENNYMTLSSYLKSSCPFNKKWYSFESFPNILTYLGCYLLDKTSNLGAKPLIVINYLDGLYNPGILISQFWVANNFGETFSRWTFFIFSKLF